ncbi:MAG: (deoxy)nucleoside triphosphate pyrophosphohydrolase [Vicinamibacterales bacterium]
MTTIVVTAAVVERHGTFLVTRRLTGTHLAGTWEFPGGKCEPDESLQACLIREMREELGVDCRVGAEIFTISHDYQDRRIQLHFFACTLEGEPAPQLGQAMQWVPRAQLSSLEFPPADDELIRLLTQNPDRSA